MPKYLEVETLNPLELSHINCMLCDKNPPSRLIAASDTLLSLFITDNGTVSWITILDYSGF